VVEGKGGSEIHGHCYLNRGGCDPDILQLGIIFIESVSTKNNRAKLIIKQCHPCFVAGAIQSLLINSIDSTMSTVIQADNNIDLTLNTILISDSVVS